MGPIGFSSLYLSVCLSVCLSVSPFDQGDSLAVSILIVLLMVQSSAFNKFNREQGRKEELIKIEQFNKNRFKEFIIKITFD